MSLKGQVALVTGASRGCGRGIAHQLGRAGATVYITALREENEDSIIQSLQHKLPYLQQVAKEVDELGGQCIPIYCDHSDSKQIEELFRRIAFEQKGQLDIVVLNAFSAVTTMLTKMHSKFFDLPENIYDVCNETGLRGQYLTARQAALLMVPRRKGLIVTISSPGGINYVFNVAYGINKAGCDRMAADMGIELREFNVTSICLYPGPVRTELFTDDVGLLSKEAVAKTYANAESIEFAGKCIVAMANDPKVHEKTGHILLTMLLAKEYDLYDEDGRQPVCPIAVKYLDYIKEVNRVRSEISLFTILTTDPT
ncbi:Dehydrogenase/reductase SDR family member 1 [Aphelenchoides besseyi]|nr:Dehydrogenase/reductase SDR family member 1 [Aphelenchoides besseyi]